jgi:hypothetical protein
MANELTVGSNYCNCHPETCCCNDWAVYSGNKKVNTFFDRAKAEEYVDVYNANLKFRQDLAELKREIEELKR